MLSRRRTGINGKFDWRWVAVTIGTFGFDLDRLLRLAAQNRDAYRDAEPYPHAVIDDFLPAAHAESVLRAFPGPESEVWLDWRQRDVDHQPRKQGIGDASRLTNVSPYLINVLNAFNSYPFLAFLSRLTGIPALLPDPYFHGGGIHQILSGGRLALHTDFNWLQELGLYRRVNVLFFLNKDWKAAYAGDLELWSRGATRCARSIQPTFNRLVVFSTTKESVHGHPRPLNTPPNVTRKSLALYFYTSTPAAGGIYDGRTDWYSM